MLVSDKYQFIIANPPKTGTTSIHALTDGFINKGGDPHVLQHMRGGEDRSVITRHRLAPPEGKEHYLRIMMCRDPRTRLTSMYEFFRLRKTDQKWIAPHIRTVERRGREAAWIWMLENFCALREEYNDVDGAGLRGVGGTMPFMWIDNQVEMREYMWGRDVDGSRLPWALPAGASVHDIELLHMETFAKDWRRLCDLLGVEEEALREVRLPRRNAVPDAERLFSDGADYWRVDGASDLFRSLCGGLNGMRRNVLWFGAGRA